MMEATVTCSAPYCGKELPLGEDKWIQLDIPSQPFLLFCNLKCLWVWARDYAETGFRLLGGDRNP